MTSTLTRPGETLLSDWLADSGLRLPEAPRLVISGSGARADRLQSLLESSEARSGTRGEAASPKRTDVFSLEVSGCELYRGATPVIRTESGAIALQDASLGAVVLNHVVGNGAEPQLEEACRLIQPGGRLFILGRNRMGLGRFLARQKTGMPAMRPLAVRSRLEALDMEVVVMHGAGLWGRATPRKVHEGMTRVMMPLAEVLLIVAKPVEPRIYNPVSARKRSTVGAPSMVAGP